ncbi:MAG: histidine kinase [Bacteroidetes bacterium]|nr:histidine kinase [Bacteroidota bacterium]
MQLSAQKLSMMQYDADNGLPSSEVYKVIKDPKGNLWFCTDRGLVIYDSYKFVVLKGENADRIFYSGEFDKNGIGWFVSQNNNYYKYINGKLMPFEYNSILRKNFKKEFINGISYNNGIYTFNVGVSTVNRFICTIKDGVLDTIAESDYIINPQPKTKNKSITYHLYFDTSYGDMPRAMMNYHEEPVKEGYTEKNGHGEFSINMLDIDYVVNTRTFVLWADKNNVILFYNHRLYWIDRLKGSMRMILRDPKLIRTHTALVHGNDIYLGVLLEGLIKLNQQTGKYAELKDFDDLSITSMYKDSENNLWISTLEKGVFILPLNLPEIPDNNKFNVQSLIKLGDKLYIGQKNGELGYYDKNYKYTKVRTFYGNVSDLLVTGKKELIAQMQNMDHPVEKITTYYLKKMVANGNQIIGFSSNAFFVADTVTWKLKQDRLRFRVYSFCPENNGKILIATDNGLERFDPLTFSAQPLNITKFRINAIVKYHNYYLIGTLGDGIYIYDAARNVVVRNIRQHNGLSSDVINSIYVSGQNEFWVGSNNGAMLVRLRYDLKIAEIILLDKSDGLPSNEVNVNYINDGYVYIGTSKGFVRIMEHTISPTLRIPNVEINYLKLVTENRNVDPSGKLEYNQNTILISYSSFINSKTLSSTTYRYAVLKNGNTDTNWIHTNETELLLANLGFGTYTFLVQGRGRYLRWGEISSLKFEIKPHFSQTLWFRIFIVTLSVALISGVVFWRFRTFRTRQRLQNMIDVEKLATLRNQMNPHFVFNALNSIQSFVFEGNTQKANYFLGSFSKLFREILDFSDRELITIEEELGFLERYLEIEKVRFHELFHYTIVCDPEIDKENTFIPPLLMQPLVENSVKHGMKYVEKEGIIEITLSMKQGFLVYRVRDNGKGIQSVSDSNHISRGMQIISNRLELLNRSRPGSVNSRLEIMDHGSEGVEAIIYLPEELVKPY